MVSFKRLAYAADRGFEMLWIVLYAGKGLSGFDSGNARAASSHERITDGLTRYVAHDLVHDLFRLHSRVIVRFAWGYRRGDVSVEVVMFLTGGMVTAMPREEIVAGAILGPCDEEFFYICDQVFIVMRCRVFLLPVHQDVAVELLLQIAFQIVALVRMKENYGLTATIWVDDRVIKAVGQSFGNHLVAGFALISPLSAARIVEQIRRVHAVTVHPAQNGPDMVGITAIEPVWAYLGQMNIGTAGLIQTD